MKPNEQGHAAKPAPYDPPAGMPPFNRDVLRSWMALWDGATGDSPEASAAVEYITEIADFVGTERDPKGQLMRPGFDPADPAVRRAMVAFSSLNMGTILYLVLDLAYDRAKRAV